MMKLFKVNDKHYVYNRTGKHLVYQSPEPEYIVLDYLESDGTQWIDTGVYPDSTYTFDTKVARTEENYNCVFWGVMSSGTVNTYNNQCFLNSNDSSSGNEESKQITLYTTSSSSQDNWKSGIIPEKNVAYNFTGITVVPTMNTMIYPISLFGLNILGVVNSELGKCRIYKWAAYSNNKLIADLIPVLDKNLVACMYDKVSGKYLYNQGSGQFKGGLADGSQIVNYLESTDDQYIDTLLPVTSKTGAFIDAEWAYENKPFSTLAGSYQSFMVLGIVPSTKRICYSYNSNPTGTTTYPLKDGTFVPSNEISSVNSSKFITQSTRFQVGLNYLGSRKWTYKTESENYENDLVDTAVQNDNTITLFSRRYSSAPQESNSYFWKGKIYSAIFTEENKIVRRFIPVIKSDGTACMYDLITKQYFVNKGTGKFIGG